MCAAGKRNDPVGCLRAQSPLHHPHPFTTHARATGLAHVREKRRVLRTSMALESAVAWPARSTGRTAGMPAAKGRRSDGCPRARAACHPVGHAACRARVGGKALPTAAVARAAQFIRRSEGNRGATISNAASSERPLAATALGLTNNTAPQDPPHAQAAWKSREMKLCKFT